MKMTPSPNRWIHIIPQKVLLIEQDETIAKILKFSLVKEGYEVDVYGIEVLDHKDVISRPYDLILYDVHLPNIRKINGIKRLKPKGSNTPIVILGQYRNEQIVVQALQMGADDYIRKPFDISVLLAKLQAILKHYRKRSVQLEVSLNDKAFRLHDIEIYPERLEIAVSGTSVALKEKEFEIFLWLLQSQGKVCHLEQIPFEAWPHKKIGMVALREYISILREKLKCFEDTFELQTIRNIGYKVFVKPNHI